MCTPSEGKGAKEVEEQKEDEEGEGEKVLMCSLCSVVLVAITRREGGHPVTRSH
jgi:hypothetical protein